MESELREHKEYMSSRLVNILFNYRQSSFNLQGKQYAAVNSGLEIKVYVRNLDQGVLYVQEKKEFSHKPY